MTNTVCVRCDGSVIGHGNSHYDPKTKEWWHTRCQKEAFRNKDIDLHRAAIMADRFGPHLNK